MLQVQMWRVLLFLLRQIHGLQDEQKVRVMCCKLEKMLIRVKTNWYSRTFPNDSILYIYHSDPTSNGMDRIHKCYLYTNNNNI